MFEPNNPDKVRNIQDFMEPSRSETFESYGQRYCLYGPFVSREGMIAALKDDPMLKPVHDNWSKFDASILETPFKYGILYLKIRWEGWYVRPVLEMSAEQFSNLLNH